jgi:hypothetical protein
VAIQALPWLEWGTSIRPSIPSSGLLGFAELIDLHLALGEHGFDLQLASHGSNHGLQGADVHIGAALHLGNGGLIDGVAECACAWEELDTRSLGFARGDRVEARDDRWSGVGHTVFLRG